MGRSSAVAVEDFVYTSFEIGAIDVRNDAGEDDIDALLVKLFERILIHRGVADRFGRSPWNAVNGDTGVEKADRKFQGIIQVLDVRIHRLVFEHDGQQSPPFPMKPRISLPSY